MTTTTQADRSLFRDLAPEIQDLVRTWLRENDLANTATELEQPACSSTWWIKIAEDAIFAIINGISIEPALAWKENGQWLCDSEAARELIRRTAGIEAAIA